MQRRLTNLLWILVLCVALALPAAAGEELIVNGLNWSRYDCSTGAFVGTFNCPSGGSVLAMEPGGIVDLAGGNTIGRYHLETGALMGNLSGLSGCLGLAYGSDGYLYASDTYANRILRFDTATGASTVLNLSTRISDPRGLAFGPDGDLYVCAGFSSIQRQVGRFDLSTGALVEKYGNNSTLLSAQQIGFASDGSLYALDQCAYYLHRLDRSDGVFDQLAAADRDAAFSSMAFGSSGDVFVDEAYMRAPSKVMRYDPQSGGLSYFAPGGSGKIAVVSTVPEPSSAMALLTGLFGILSVARFRRC